MCDSPLEEPSDQVNPLDLKRMSLACVTYCFSTDRHFLSQSCSEIPVFETKATSENVRKDSIFSAKNSKSPLFQIIKKTAASSAKRFSFEAKILKESTRWCQPNTGLCPIILYVNSIDIHIKRHQQRPLHTDRH